LTPSLIPPHHPPYFIPLVSKLKFAKCWKAQLTGMRKRAGRKEYNEKDREDGGRMVKR
jgi:hypothetical protein